jgi:ABC-type nitrate/sulfonate/bicarbonate transport system permease component
MEMSTERVSERETPRFGERLRSVLLTNKKVIAVESVVTLLVVWYLLGNVIGLHETLSSPVLVGGYLYELLVTGEFYPHLAATIKRVVYAFIATIVVGTILGLVMGLWKFWESALKDIIIIGMAFPSLFAVIFAAMWFGYSPITPTVAGALISFPYLTQSLYNAVKDVDNDLVNMSRSFDIPRRQILTRLVLRSILPQWVAGVRYSMGLTWKIVVLAELFMAREGLGFMIQWELEALSLTGIISWTLLFIFVVLFLEYAVIQQFEKRVFDWREDTSGVLT